MPLSIEKYATAIQQLPNQDPLTLEEDGRITSAPLHFPTLSTFLISNLLGTADDINKKHFTIIVDFKNALKAKYGATIANFAFPRASEKKANAHGLQGNVVSEVLKDAEIISLLSDAIVESIEENHEEPADSPFTSVPGKGALLFSEDTINSIKEAYDDTNKELHRCSQEPRLRYYAPPSLRIARLAIINDLNKNHDDHPTFPLEAISKDIVINAMIAAINASPEVRNHMDGFRRSPYNAMADVVETPMAFVAEETPSMTPMDAVATPLSPAVTATRLHNTEWHL